jgi:Fe-S-cluster containining protein
MSMSEGYDCQTCGACCVDFTGTHGYVRLAPREAPRFRRLGLPVVGESGESILGTRADGEGRDVCAAFAGAVGGACSCSVYPSRPRVCQTFEAGGPQCREARRAVGLPA